MTIYRYDILEARRLLHSDDQFKLHLSSRPEKNPAARIAVAMNPQTDYEDLQALANDPEPLIAEIAKARLEELDHLVQLYKMWATSSSSDSDTGSAKPVDALDMAALRHMTGSNAERLTVAECIDLVRKTIQI